LTADADKNLGTVRIAQGVLVTIVNATAQGVPGVLRMGDATRNDSGSGLGRIFHRDENSGVRVEVRDEKVLADLYLVVSKDANMLEVGKQVQRDVSEAIRKMLGMPVEQVNVYIQNVE
jgi:uncharacterized alkaline shock family protein YloU